MSVDSHLKDRFDAFVLKFMANRTDAYGTYRGKAAVIAKEPLVSDKVFHHFICFITIGLFTTSREQTCRWCVWDFDNHDGAEDIAERNLRDATDLFEELRALGAEPILEDSNGDGGYHVWVIFERPVATPDVYAWAQALRPHREVETFPKQATVAVDGYGNWVRLPGKHHKRDHRSRAWCVATASWIDWPDCLELFIDAPRCPAELLPPSPGPAPGSAVAAAPRSAGDVAADVRTAIECLARLPKGMADDRDTWIKVGMILHAVDAGPEMLARWVEWSRDSSKFKPGECEAKWTGFRAGGGLGLGTLVLLAGGKPAADVRGDDDRIVLDPSAPLVNARRFLALRHEIDGVPTLHFHDGVFRAWQDSFFREVEDEAMRSGIYCFLENAWVEKRIEGEPYYEKYVPDKSGVDRLLDALRAAAHLPRSRSPACWLSGGEEIDPRAVVALRNGIYHLGTGVLHPPTPRFFNFSALPYDFDLAAPSPERWLAFLRDLWGGDGQAIQTLQEMFGYLLTVDTGQQKIFLVVGPKRSGKGTIGRVLTGLVGKENVCGPTLAGLSQNFGLHTLIGRQVALISDARLGGRSDEAVIAERLLSISGEDCVDVPRKFLPDWRGHLSARFVILTNEIPRLADASGALPSRFIVLTLRRSFYGEEDLGLTQGLLAELPGILNWSIEGWHRLHERGRFVQPDSSAGAVGEMADLASPVAAFVREMCVLDTRREISAADLFAAWAKWCDACGRKRKGTVQTLGRNLRAAFPCVTTHQPRAGDNGRPRLFKGIGLA